MPDLQICNTPLMVPSPGETAVERQWHAVMTLCRHEKAVAARLTARSVATFVPLYRAEHLWNGRRAAVDLPLFPGYLFVQLSRAERTTVLGASGVLGLVNVRGIPVPLDPSLIQGLRALVEMRKAEPHEYLPAGKRVRIVAGPLRNQTGVVVSHRSGLRVVVTIEPLQRSILVEVATSDLLATAA